MGTKEVSKTRSTIIAIVALALVSTGLLVTAAQGTKGELELIETPAAVAQTLAGACASTPSTPVCKEVCMVTIEGHILPQGQFVCTPDD